MKTVLITAGNRGLGRALVERFGSQDSGWQVIATARNKDSLRPVASHLHAALALDLASSESIAALVASLEHETIDLVIHNAGYNPKDSKQPGYFESTFYVANFSAAHVAESCMINALHPMELTSKLLPLLSDDATVMAISSWLGSMEKKNVPGHYGYSGSKALLNMMIRGLAMEFAKQSPSSSSSSSGQQQRSAIVVNPGWMQTDMGGTNADRTASQVADDIFALVATPGLLRELNGKFVNPDGSQHPW